MNDDLKAYIDGELPPDAAERLRDVLDLDPSLSQEAEDFRRISACLRTLPEPEPVGQAATLAALANRRPSFFQNWGLSLAACAGVLFVATWISSAPGRGPYIQVNNGSAHTAAPPVEVTIPAARREAFIRFIHDRGGMVRPDGDVLLAFYPLASQSELTRRFSLPEDTPWPSEGLRVHFDQ